MTDIDLDAIEARANAATPGPWFSNEPGGSSCGGPLTQPYISRKVQNADGRAVNLVVAEITMAGDMELADFIAHSRTDVPALIAEIRRLRARVAELEAVDAERSAFLDARQRSDDKYNSTEHHQ